MKLTKTELKEMIKEVLREELSKKPLKEDLSRVDQELAKLEDFELEYGGYEDEWYEDRWDPMSQHGHYQNSGTTRHGDFTYTVSAEDMFEYIGSELLSIERNPEKSPLIKEVFRLSQAWDDAYDKYGDSVETDKAEEELNLYIIQHLDEFFTIYEKESYAHYEEAAYDWSRDNY